MRVTLFLPAVVLSTLLSAAPGSAEMFDGVTVWTNLRANELFFFDHLSNTKVDLYQGSSKCRAPVISPDGTRVAWTENNRLWVINGDGTGAEEICGCTTERNKGRTELTWTEKGIMWAEPNSDIMLADPDAGTCRKVFGYNDGTKVPQWFGASADGRTLMVWQHGEGADSDYDPLITMNADLTGGSKEWVDIWGHGWFITRDGAHVLINAWSSSRGRTCGAQHRVFVVYETAGNQDVVKCFPSGLPDPQETLTYGLDYCVNDDSLFLFRSRGDTATDTPSRYWVMNWHTEQRREMDPADIGEEESYSLEPGTLWKGRLPARGPVDGPLIELDRRSVSFAAVGGVFAPETVTVANRGTGTLATVTVSEDAQWLTSTVSGAEPQVIANTVDATGLAAGVYTATVVVSGGGAQNQVPYEVTLNVGSALAAPTGLKASLSANADSITLSWTDNADGETGYSIERSIDGSAWEAVGETADDTVSFVDTVGSEGEYSYRVRALGDPTPSGYSNTATVLVSFEPSVAITHPVAGDVVAAGQQVRIRWDAVNVGLVAIEYSANEGETWEPITVAGGLADTDSLWANYPWIVPADAQSIMVKVYEYGNETVGDISDLLPVAVDGHAAVDRGPARQMLRIGSRAGAVSFEVGPGLGDRSTITVYSSDGRRVAGVAVPAIARARRVSVSMSLRPGRYVAVLSNTRATVAGAHRCKVFGVVR